MTTSVFVDRTAVLEAAKVPPSNFNQSEIADRIIADGEVRTIAMQLAIDAYVLEAIGRVASRDRLHKRVGIHVPTPVPSGGWYVNQTNTDGVWYLVYRAPSGEHFRYSGHPDAAPAALKQFGEIPPAILNEYRQRLGLAYKPIVEAEAEKPLW
jgi:hypothetical protein